MSHTVILKFYISSNFTLNPYVGLIDYGSVFHNLFKIVVLPELSNPTSTILAFFSYFLN